jgi:small-conductance mechanosensitive channel
MPRRQAFAAALCVTALAVLSLTAVYAQAPSAPASGSPAAPAVSAPTASHAIPAAEIIVRSSEVAALLSATLDRFAPTDEIDKIQKSLPELTRQIDLDFTDTSVTLGEQPPLTTIQAEQARWQQRQLHVSGWLGVLTRRAVEIRAAHDHLARTVEIWTLTRDALRSEQAPAAIQQQALATLAAVEAAQAQLKSLEDAALGLQGGLAAELARCDEALGQIGRAQKSAVVGILNRESLPVWTPALWDTAYATLPDRLLGIARGFGTNIREYLFDPARGLPAHALLFGVLALGAVAARHRKRRWAHSGIGVSAAVNVFERPFSVALMLTLWAASAAMSPAPARVRDLLLALAILPVIRLVRPMADPRALPIVYGAVLLYLVDFVRRAVGGTHLIEQLLLILESVAAAGAVTWLLQKERLRGIPGQLPAILRSRFAPAILKVTVIGLAAGALSAAFGFTRLARLVTPAILNGTTLALILFGAVRATRGALAIGLRVPPLDRLQIVRRHCDLLETWAQRLLVWGAMFVWARRFLDYIGLLDPVVWAVDAVLAARFERGSISISIEDVLAFGVTVWASYLVSGLIRFALKEEVYPRRGISRGMSYAYSRLVHYVVLAMGFLFGLGVLGLDLSKISVLAGAFGVGIGFGLQDVVNNFVCGLILLFERPVHAGDIVEVGGLQGEVRRIGIRASTIHTYQGADIVVPNSQFITATVTNWTLSDQLRRIDLPVGVNYGAAPRMVIELLEATARANPNVLAEPPPQCLFTGYGDSSITFELRAWTDRFDTWGGVRSALATAVYDAVYAAGLSFPFPQREVRVVGAAVAAESPTAADDLAAAPSIVPESKLPQAALEPLK